MRQILVRGRGGQGARLACRVLAAAFARAGWRARALAATGAEPPGAPVAALVHVDDHAADRDDVVLLDPALLGTLPGSAAADGLVLVASAVEPCGWAPGAAAVVALDAAAIAASHGLEPAVASAMVGGFAAVTGLLPLETLEAAIAESHPTRPDAHLAACRAGYRAAVQARADHLAT